MSTLKDGVDDLVLLDSINEVAVYETLRKRYDASLIYTFIGQVLIACNPYKDLGIYSKAWVKKYEDRYIFEEAPHVFAIAELAYRSLLNEGVNQCIIISGESGAGKTVSAKKIMEFIAAVTGRVDAVKNIREQILESNPVLEAFGNAKTVQNDNSSRFGKYFEIQFNYGGDPIGGRITNYLLEKSRVMTQAPNERNFHVFYQLLAGASATEKDEYGLSKPEDFYYLSQSGCVSVGSIDDARDYQLTRRAMTTIGFTPEEQGALFQTVAAVLHLGNLGFKDGPRGTEVINTDTLEFAAYLLGVEAAALGRALTTRSRSAGGGGGGETVVSPLNVEQANYARDSLAKDIYSRMFDWIVQRINTCICDDTSEYNIGVLDIYGFEIFDHNSFEQLCINYVNEQLQQIFIDLTLKTEQEEYRQEGIPWENVDYFDNKPCVELVSGRGGIFKILDEECVFPKGTDKSFLEKLVRTCGSKPYFLSGGSGIGGSKVASPRASHDTFGMEHYAGKVHYNVKGFLDKNKDNLFRDLKHVMTASAIPMIRELFPAELLSMKRPPTAATQFSSQVTALIATLRSCSPHYIRCIRPNSTKAPLMMEDTLTQNQIRYLGLLENVRVRRAGYCYRNTYERFWNRFRVVSTATFPKFSGSPKDGTAAIMKECGITGAGAFEFGKTKIFIRNPQTLFTLEERRVMRMHEVAKIIQRKYRQAAAQAYYRKLRNSVAELFWGNKERNRLSCYRQYMGDYVSIRGRRLHKGITKKFGDKKIVFSDKVAHINPKNGKPANRVFILTEKQILLYGGGFFGKKVALQVPLTSVTGVELTTRNDGAFILHLSGMPDEAFWTEKKVEIIVSLHENYKWATSDEKANLPVTFTDADSLRYTSKGGERTISIVRDPAIPKETAKGGKGATIVTVPPGLEKTAGPKKRVKSAKAEKSRAINRGGRPKEGMAVVCRAQANTDYTAKNARELSFKAGDMIAITSKSTSGIWQGTLRGKTGTVMSHYLTVVS